MQETATFPLRRQCFYFYSTSEASDYRPVLNADATVMIFERTFEDRPAGTKLYSANLIARLSSRSSTLHRSVPIGAGTGSTAGR
jgi:hypothetical protein